MARRASAINRGAKKVTRAQVDKLYKSAVRAGLVKGTATLDAVMKASALGDPTVAGYVCAWDKYVVVVA